MPDASSATFDVNVTTPETSAPGSCSSALGATTSTFTWRAMTLSTFPTRSVALNFTVVAELTANGAEYVCALPLGAPAGRSPAGARAREAVVRDARVGVGGGGGDREAARLAAAEVNGRAGRARVRERAEGEARRGGRGGVDHRVGARGRRGGAV